MGTRLNAHARMHAHTCMPVHVGVLMYAHMCMHVPAYACMLMETQILIYTLSCTPTHVHPFMYTHFHVHPVAGGAYQAFEWFLANE